jgi:hypothetical protein
LPADYVAASPLLGVCGLTAAEVGRRLDEWKALGQQACQNLGLPAFKEMNEAQK